MKLLLKYVYFATILVAMPNSTHAQVKNSEQENLNTPVTLEFICQGNYLEIMGSKYYDNDAAFVCSSDLTTLFWVSLIAYHPDGTPFPASTIWEANGTQFAEGPNAILSSVNYEPLQLNNPTVKAYYINGTDEISVTVSVTFTRIEFRESTMQAHGFDPNKQHEQYYPSYISGIAWKSLPLNGMDIFEASMVPSDVYPHVTIHSSNQVNFPVTPNNPTFNTQILTAGANVLGSAHVYSQVEGQDDPCTVEGVNSQVNVVSYMPKSKMVKFIVVQEENDDVQTIGTGQGGNPYQVCVSPGSNNFRDTPKDPSNDDEVTSDDLYINTGANGISETQALNVNTNYTMAAAVDLEEGLEYLNQVYKGAIKNWNVASEPGESVLINYDLDRDGKLDIGPEMQIIVNSGCCPEDDDLYYVFLVDKLQLSGEPYGFALGQTRYVWVASDQGSANDVYDTIAHELGHALGLQHPFEQFSGFPQGYDPFNVMDYTIQGFNQQRSLRKYQWDELIE